MGPPLDMRSVVDRNDVMQRMTNVHGCNLMWRKLIIMSPIIYDVAISLNWSTVLTYEMSFAALNFQ
jgi:hypothetical protein